MSSRRRFIGQVIGGTAALAASGINPSAAAAAQVAGANDRIRIALIGCGGRGTEILKAALRIPNTQCVAVADVYTHRLGEIKSVVPNAKPYKDFRQLLDDKSIDAVLIATPQHQHALNFVPAIEAGKDVYQEKTMAFNPDHAKRMRRALQGSNRVVQVGIQSTSSRAVERVKEHLTPAKMGQITVVVTHHYRNAPYGGWKRSIPPDCTPQNVDWKMFQGEAPPHDFDPNRVINWRFYWDYSGGNVFENAVHQIGFWYKVLDLKIPRTATMNGGNYFSPEMQVPDTMNFSMDQPENLLFTWNSGFGNNYYGEDNDLIFGRSGTLLRKDDDVRYLPQGHGHHPAQALPPGPRAATPDIVGGSDETDIHMQNFFDCVRSRKTPNCPFEIGFRSAIAARMALVSLSEGRMVKWDAEREGIV